MSDITDKQKIPTCEGCFSQRSLVLVLLLILLLVVVLKDRMSEAFQRKSEEMSMPTDVTLGSRSGHREFSEV